MKRAWRPLALVTVLGACEGRELAVFDVSAGDPRGGTASSGASGAAERGGGGTSDAGASAGGSYVPIGGGAGGPPEVAGESGAAGSTNGPRTCTEDPDCDGGWVCEKPDCDAPQGVCIPWPPLCTGDPAPVCGCDGVTYWNDCIRLSSPSHPPLASFGQCRTTASRCDVGADCNVPYASCSHLMAPGELCGQSAGSCWVLPFQCRPSSDDRLWRECRPPDQGPPPPFCVDTCRAIASERPHALVRHVDTCN